MMKSKTLVLAVLLSMGLGFVQAGRLPVKSHPEKKKEAQPATKDLPEIEKKSEKTHVIKQLTPPTGIKKVPEPSGRAPDDGKPTPPSRPFYKSPVFIAPAAIGGSVVATGLIYYAVRKLREYRIRTQANRVLDQLASLRRDIASDREFEAARDELLQGVSPQVQEVIIGLEQDILSKEKTLEQKLEKEVLELEQRLSKVIEVAIERRLEDVEIFELVEKLEKEIPALKQKLDEVEVVELKQRREEVLALRQKLNNILTLEEQRLPEQVITAIRQLIREENWPKERPPFEILDFYPLVY